MPHNGIRLGLRRIIQLEWRIDYIIWALGEWASERRWRHWRVARLARAFSPAKLNNALFWRELLKTRNRKGRKDIKKKNYPRNIPFFDIKFYHFIFIMKFIWRKLWISKNNVENKIRYFFMALMQEDV